MAFAFGIARRQLLDCLVELLLPAEDDVVLQHFGGEAAPVKLGAAGTRAPVVQELPAQAMGPCTRWITSVIGISTTRAPS